VSTNPAGESTLDSDRDAVAPSRGVPSDLDNADRRLIQLLTDDGRMNNRSLAAEIGLSEPTVAARLRSLNERHFLGVTASLDWVAAGYLWDAYLEIRVEGRSVKGVSIDLAKVEGVHHVNVVFGPFELLVHVLLGDATEAIGIIADRIGSIPGVQSVRPNVTLETIKFETKHARLPIRPIPLRFPQPVVDLDETDRALIDLLIGDGRRSNREAARLLGISEGTIRLRLRRLEDAGLLRITARSDPYLTGEVNAWAAMGIDAESGATREVARSLAALSETAFVSIVAGSHDIFTAVAVATRERLDELVLEEIRALPGVRATSTWEIVATQSFHYQWARLLGGHPGDEQA